MKGNELNRLGGTGFYICWSNRHFMFVYSACPPKEDLLFEINDKWIFENEMTASGICCKLNAAMEKSGRLEETPPIKDIEKGTRVYVPGWSTEEGKFHPIRAYFEQLVQHLFRQVFLSEEECRNYCNHLNAFVKEIEPK